MSVCMRGLVEFLRCFKYNQFMGIRRYYDSIRRTEKQAVGIKTAD